MAADLSASAYLVDGVDLAASGVELTHDGAGLWTGIAEDVAVSTYPGADFGDVVGGAFRPFTQSILYTIRGADAEATWAGAVALRRRCKPGRTVALTRLMPDPEGSDANVAQVATARRQGDRPGWLGLRGVTLDIDWLIASPWFGDAVTIASAAGAQTIKGDVRTRKLTVDLAAGAARTVTNTTNGFWFTYSGSVPAGGIRVDVLKRTAVVISSGLDVSTYLSWGKAAPMQLEPGSNTFTVSSGSASISYQPGYL